MKRYLTIIIVFLFTFVIRVNAEDYKTGDLIKYNNIDFYVIEDKGDYLTLLKAKPLTWDEVKSVSDKNQNDSSLSEYNIFYYYTEYAKVAYYTSDKCKYSKSDDSLTITNEECKTDYEDSDIKNIVDNWSNSALNQGDLKDANVTYQATKDNTVTKSYKARLITLDEYQKLYKSFSNKGLSNAFNRLIDIYPFWTMVVQDSNYTEGIPWISHSSWVADQYLMVRPVIHLSKDANFQSNKRKTTKKTINDKEYKVGDIVRYDGIDFYVIKDSNQNDKTVTMIKAVPLTMAEIASVIDDWENRVTGQDSYYDDITSASYNVGYSIYYSDENCTTDYESNNGGYTNISSCKTDYKESYVKKIVDGWVNNKLGDLNLVEDNGNKARLITIDEITTELFYQARANTLNQSTINKDYYAYTDDTPFTLGRCWTMTPQGDDNYLVYRIESSVKFANYINNSLGLNTNYDTNSISNRGGVITTNVANFGAVCPVITINKTNSVNNKVNVPNTLLNNPVFIVVVGIILIVVATITVSLILKRKK